MNQLAKFLKSISDPNRMKILFLLKKKPLCVCELQTLLNIAQPTVSAHLKILSEVGLISSQKNGLWINYKISKHPDSIINNILQNMFSYLSTDTKMDNLLNQLETLDRYEICNRNKSPKGGLNE